MIHGNEIQEEGEALGEQGVWQQQLAKVIRSGRFCIWPYRAYIGEKEK